MFVLYQYNIMLAFIQSLKTSTCDTQEGRIYRKKVFLEFNKLFDSAHHIISIEIIPETECTENSCPITLVEGHLGVKLWCIPYIYREAYEQWNTLMQSKTQIRKWHEILRSVLLFCPGTNTAWNCMKEQISKGKPIDNDLNLTRLTLQLHPKSLEAFSHRRWLLCKADCVMKLQTCMGVTVPCDSQTKYKKICHQWCSKSDVIPLWKENTDMIEAENEFCEKIICRHKNNYTVWSHKQFIHQTFVCDIGFRCLRVLREKMLCSDCCYHLLLHVIRFVHLQIHLMSRYMEKNISETSGWTHLSYLILKWHQLVLQYVYFCNSNESNLLFCEMKEMWNNILEQNTSLIEMYSDGFQCLWHFRKHLFLLNLHLSSHHKNFGIKIAAFTLQNQEEFYDKITSTSTSSQLEYCKQYFDFVEKCKSKNT